MLTTIRSDRSPVMPWTTLSQSCPVTV